jgi:hypothetical protein
MRLETVASIEEEEQNLALISRMKKGSKKGGPEEGSKEQGGRIRFFGPGEERLESREVFQVPQDGPLCISMS